MRWISALWAGALIEAAAAEGAAREPLCRAGQIDLTATDLAEQRIAEMRHLATWAAVMSTLRDPGFPIRFGSSFAPDAYDLLGLACKTAGDLGDAFARITRYLHIWTNTVEVALATTDSLARVTIKRTGPRDLAMRCASESAVAEVVQATRTLAATDVCIEQAYFAHAAPADVSVHADFFGCPLVFGAAFDGVELDRAALASPLRLADPGLSRFLLSELDRRAAEQPTGENFTGTVRRAVGDALPNGRPSAKDVAKQLGVSSRTLQRRLERESTQLSVIIEETRRQIAEELLLTDRPIAEIAFLVGYSEPSAFHRAFKRWTGKTPREVTAAKL